MATVLAVGGAHIDRKGWLSAPHRAGASNPGRWESEPGGGTFNAARNLARLGHDVVLVSPRGGDPEADDVARAARLSGITDRPVTFLDRRTPTYSAILEPDGELVTALADMALYEAWPGRRLASSRLRTLMSRADLVLTDANLREDALAALADMAAALERPLAAIAISPAKAMRFARLLPSLSFLSMNRAEAGALAADTGAADASGLVRALAASGLRAGVVTAGALAAAAFSETGTVILTPPAIDGLRDVTGAGDALAAGMLDARLNGLPLRAGLIRGMAAARLTASVRGPVDPQLTRSCLDEEAARITPLLTAPEAG